MTISAEDWKLAEEINDSPALMSVYAAPQWDELSNDGKAWVAALVAETMKRSASVRLPVEALADVIDDLTSDEGDTVTFCSRNADFNGMPNDCVTVNASWTEWTDRDFRADTRQQCLDLALKAKGRAKVDAEYDKVLAQLDKLGTGRCDSCGRKVSIGDLDAKPGHWDLLRTAILHPISSIRFGLLETCADHGVNFTRLECRDCYGWRHVEGPST